MPKISIIIPVFNNADSIQETLESIFTQTFTDFEVIAVNDGSIDNSAQILDSIATQEPRLQVIHLKSNVGVYEARSAGLKVSKGDFIGFVDADDFVKPNMYSILFDACNYFNADIAICGVDLVSTNREFLSSKVLFKADRTIDNNIFETFCSIKLGTGSLWNKLYRKELIMQHGLMPFRWRQDTSEDTLVNIGCFINAKRVCVINKSLYEYVKHSESATQLINNSNAFVQTLRAYAIAVDTYHHYGRKVLDCITELYMRQLYYDCYHISEIAELSGHEESLREAVELLSEQHPSGLACLANKGLFSPHSQKTLGRRIDNMIQRARLMTSKLLK